jgi:hypothetical protein
VPVSKDQTQSHLHSQQVNAKSTNSSAMGLPASHSATALKIYEHRAGSPRNERFSLPRRLCHKLTHKTSAKKTYYHPACPPTQRVLSAKKTYDHPACPPLNGWLQVHTSGSPQAALFSANNCRRVSINDSRERWC